MYGSAEGVITVAGNRVLMAVTDVVYTAVVPVPGIGAVFSTDEAVVSDAAFVPVPTPATEVISLIVRPLVDGIDSVKEIAPEVAGTLINGLPPNVVAPGKVTGIAGRLSRTSGPYSRSSLQAQLVTISRASRRLFMIVLVMFSEN